MQMLDTDTLKFLLKPRQVAVSIYLSLRPEERDLRLQSAELRNAVDEVGQRLEANGVDPHLCETIISATRQHISGLDLSAHRDPCLAIFADESETRLVSLPETLPYDLALGHHFNVKPLLPLLDRNRRFWLLALSAGRARLFSVTPFEITEVDLALAHRVVDTTAPGEPAADQGGSADETQAMEAPDSLLESLSDLVRTVEDRIGGDTAPVLLAAEPRIGGHFRKTVHLPGLLEEGLVLNPHAFSLRDLQQKALEAVRPQVRSQVNDVLEQIQARLGDAASNVAVRLEEILAAADEGRVDAVIVASDEALWGRYEPGSPITAHGHRVSGDEDLLNRAAVATMRNGGRSFSLPKTQIPRNSLAAATLRF
ncbi:baeRF3 domain-containing protein [Teichococcus vastitatis]|uniref:Uncharacterized protein n=1 Tax=Teichococcus vastitatis TaxID=2307076 RepID=A0ABS9WA72_9PROT|nr:hypothetical protein [Pseudoroseomonas vastitatis]MCI0755888.1 hypothetical protein [Pseudoroseomonas vastitatis]